jgi:regulator of ribonuclease activity A
MLGELAVNNGWSGIVVHGCVRDVVELRAQAVGIRALASHPRKSAKGTHGGVADVMVEILGARMTSGHWLYADEDGILVSQRALL